VIGADGNAFSAKGTFMCIVVKFGVKVMSLGVAAPLASEGATFEKNQRSDARAVV
jgi:hypothetical protein